MAEIDRRGRGDPTFIVYTNVVKVMGGRPVYVKLKNHVHDLNAVLGTISQRAKLVFVCNPNNPRGTIVRKQELEDFISKLPENAILVLDEAYFEFVRDEGYPDGLDYIKQGYNVISLRTQASRLLPSIIRELEEAGVERKEIKIVMSTGAHRPMDRFDLIKKLGEIVYYNMDIRHHHPFENILDLGVSSRGIPIHMNKLFMEAHIKVGVGCVVPHSYAGFGGGGQDRPSRACGIDTLDLSYLRTTQWRPTLISRDGYDQWRTSES